MNKSSNQKVEVKANPLYDNGAPQEDYDTDFTFCDDEDLVFSNKYMNSSDPNASEIESICATLKEKNRWKGKTIFTLELEPPSSSIPKNIPVSTDHRSHTPGEFGDGYSFSLLRKYEQATEEDDQSDEESTSDNVDTRECNGSMCKIKLPYKSSSAVFFRQGRESSNGPFTIKFKLENPTSSSKAFKILCNKSAHRHFTFRPRYGIIPPQSWIYIWAKTKTDEETGQSPRNDTVFWDRIVIKFFPAYFGAGDLNGSKSKDFEERLDMFLKMLETKFPDLIHSCKIRNISLFDAKDLPSMEIPLSEVLKYEPYHYSVEDHNKIKRTYKLWSARLRIFADNETLRKYLRRLLFIRKFQEIGIFIGMCAFVAIYIMPFLSTKVVMPPAGFDESLKSNIGFIGRIRSLFY